MTTLSGPIPGTPVDEPGGSPAAAAAYKDFIDKVFQSQNDGDNGEKGETGCGKYAIAGRCSGCGETFARELLCGREWCPTCGQNWSSIHQQRFSRLLPKARQMESIGYFVIEFPLISRAEYRTKEALREFGKRVKGAFIALGYSRGIRRWHWFGEKGLVYNPHLNVLIEGGFIPPGDMEGMKQFLRNVLDEPELIINYHYRESIPEKVHTLKYATRATFLERSWDNEMAAELYNFRTTTYWGRWKDEPLWGLEDLSGVEITDMVGSLDQDAVTALLEGKCPCCGEPIVWTRPVDVKALMYRQLLIIRGRVDDRARDAPMQSVTKRLICAAQKVGQDLEMIKVMRGIQSRRGKTEPNLIPMDCVRISGGVPVGAGYWRMPKCREKEASASDARNHGLWDSAE